MTDLITPNDLARELGVSAKKIREYLRSKYGKLSSFETRWHLTESQASDVRVHFSQTIRHTNS
jgi:hypothetical protein